MGGGGKIGLHLAAVLRKHTFQARVKHSTTSRLHDAPPPPPRHSSGRSVLEPFMESGSQCPAGGLQCPSAVNGWVVWVVRLPQSVSAGRENSILTASCATRGFCLCRAVPKGLWARVRCCSDLVKVSAEGWLSLLPHFCTTYLPETQQRTRTCRSRTQCGCRLPIGPGPVQRREKHPEGHRESGHRASIDVPCEKDNIQLMFILKCY